MFQCSFFSCVEENLIIEVIKLGIKYDLILHKEGIQYPPSQSKMREYFGEGRAAFHADDAGASVN